MKIVLALGRDPWPPRRGDQLRANQLLAALGAAHSVTVLAPVSSGAGAGGPGSIEVVRFRLTAADRARGLLGSVLAGRPLQAGLFASRDLDRRLARLACEADLVIVQLARLERAVRSLRAAAPDVPVVVDLIDALSLGAASRAAVDRQPRRALLRWEAARLARLERGLVEVSARALVVAPRDLEAIAGDRRDLRRKLTVVPLALESSEAGAAASRGPRVVLSGNLGYFVNRDAVLWTLREVWPRLREAREGVQLTIAGARPDGGLRRAVGRAGAELLADPPSLREVLEQATVSLAPMRCGSGTPVKVLEAWASGVPVVASPYAAAGTAGVAGRDLLVADRPADWVRSILRLLDDAEEASRLANAARDTLEREHSPRRVRATLEGVVEAAVG